MKVCLCSSPDKAIRFASRFLARQIPKLLRTRPTISLALSGGNTGERLLRVLANETVAWNGVHVLQVDERVAALDSGLRNLPQLTKSLVQNGLLALEQLHPMPVDAGEDLSLAAQRYAQCLLSITGPSKRIDVVQLGLGDDGHTASLVPGDAVLTENTAEVAVTGPYRGARRMTLTFPAINRARTRIWVVTGKEKSGCLAGMLAGDEALPASNITKRGSIVIADKAACADIRGYAGIVTFPD